jgi:Short C-terminal domain
MFGSTDRLEKKLRNGGGKTAPAKITEAKPGRFAVSSGGDTAQLAASAHVNWTLKLQVTPDGESPFDAVVKEPYPEMGGGPSVGSTLGVLYDPNDHTKVVVDHSDAGQATMVAGRMSPAAKSALEQAGGEPAEQLMQEAIADPAAFREKMRAGRSGPVVMVGGQQVSGAPVAAAKPTDTADEIAKLADLRDRGALSEDEFQAQKKKNLGT